MPSSAARTRQRFQTAPTASLIAASPRSVPCSTRAWTDTPFPLHWLREVLSSSASANGKLFASVIYTYMDTGGWCWPGVDLIAEKMSKEERVVSTQASGAPPASRLGVSRVRRRRWQEGGCRGDPSSGDPPKPKPQEPSLTACDGSARPPASPPGRASR